AGRDVCCDRLAVRYGRDDEIWDVASGLGFRVLHHDLEGNHAPPRSFVGPNTVDFSPDGRLLASAGCTGVRLWDAATRKELASFQAGLCTPVLFHPKGTSLIPHGQDGLRRWPIHTVGPAPGEIRLGPPQHLGLSGQDTHGRACWGRDGRLLAAADNV